MNDRILFIIFNNQIQYCHDPNSDHRNFYQSLGGNPNDYENTIKGYIFKDKIVFFKNNLTYDEEVINMAKRCAPAMKQQLNNPYLKVCCGINPGQNGTAWEPILTLNDSELTGYVTNKEIEQKQQAIKESERQQRIARETTTVVDFKNNYDDPKFIKFAIIFTIVILVLTVLSKLYLVYISEENITGLTKFLMVAQILLLIGTLIGYIQKKEYSKYLGIGATVALVMMFNIIDIIIGVINFLFTVDQGYIVSILNSGKKGISKIQGK